MQVAAQEVPVVRRRIRLSSHATPAPEPVVVPAAGREVTSADNGGPVVTEEMKATLRAFADANTRKNAASREETAAKKKLHALMAQGDVENMSETIGGEEWAAEISRGESVEVDVVKLKALVDDATFMRIISATQASVKKHVGTNMLAKCTKRTPSEPSLSVGKK